MAVDWQKYLNDDKVEEKPAEVVSTVPIEDPLATIHIDGNGIIGGTSITGQYYTHSSAAATDSSGTISSTISSSIFNTPIPKTQVVRCSKVVDRNYAAALGFSDHEMEKNVIADLCKNLMKELVDRKLIEITYDKDFMTLSNIITATLKVEEPA